MGMHGGTRFLNQLFPRSSETFSDKHSCLGLPFLKWAVFIQPHLTMAEPHVTPAPKPAVAITWPL